MELWIRSQDKEELVKLSGTRINSLIKTEIIGFVEHGGRIILGIYATKKRALEVLDEIQEYLINLDRAVIYSQTPFEDYSNVYEMPEE